jgi:excisionase family DNA binding protein
MGKQYDVSLYVDDGEHEVSLDRKVFNQLWGSSGNVPLVQGRWMSIPGGSRCSEEGATTTLIQNSFNSKDDSRENRFVGSDGEELVELSGPVAAALREVIEHMSRGAAVSIVPLHKELTTQQAADILNVSRQYLVRLLDRGEIPHHKVNRHRRIRFGELMEYKERRDARRREGLRKLTQLSQELNQVEPV